MYCYFGVMMQNHYQTVHRDLYKFIEDNFDLFEDFSEWILQGTKMIPEDHLDQLSHPNIYRADEIGLCLLAHIYELKVAVCLPDKSVWFTTQNCSKVEGCDMFLGYIGVRKFVLYVPNDTDQ